MTSANYLEVHDINILNHDSHIDTVACIDMLSYYPFLPLMIRPTRVGSQTSISIDNSLTKNVENLNHSDQGILDTDLNDH